MDGNALCVIDNKLVEGKYKLTAVECRLIMHCISRIGKNDEAFKTYEYTGSELVKALGLGENNNGYIIEVIETLMKKTVKIRRPKSYLVANWLGGETEIFDDGRITIRFSEKLKPYLLQLKEQFTPLQFECMMKFGSVYASRIYMLAKQYERAKVRCIAISELRSFLQIEKEYARFMDLKNWVLIPAEREINKHSDIRIKITPDIKTRKRKSYTNLIFFIQPANPESKVIAKQKRSGIANAATVAEDRLAKKHLRDVAAFKKLSEEDQKLWIGIAKSNVFFIPGTEVDCAVQAWQKHLKELASTDAK